VKHLSREQLREKMPSTCVALVCTHECNYLYIASQMHSRDNQKMTRARKKKRRNLDDSDATDRCVSAEWVNRRSYALQYRNLVESRCDWYPSRRTGEDSCAMDRTLLRSSIQRFNLAANRRERNGRYRPEKDSYLDVVICLRPNVSSSGH